MFIERDGPKSSLIASEINQATKEFVIGKFAGLALKLAENNIIKPMTPEFPEGFEKVFSEAMLDKNIVPLLICSHEGHADGLLIAVVSKKLKDMANKVSCANGDNPGNRLQGFVLPIAASLRAGHQGLFLKQALIQAEKSGLASSRSLFFIDYVREKDVQKYGMRSNKLTFTRDLGEKIKKGYGIADFPERSIQSGRRNENGISGMQQIDCDNLYTIIKIIKKQEMKPLIIPIGVYGTFKMVNSNIDKKANQPANSIGLQELKTLVGLGIKNLMSLKVGMPIKDGDLVKKLIGQGKEITPETIGNYLGRMIASLLPPNARGVYA